jgi:hypothetical protein
VASRLLLVVQPSSDRTLDPVRRDNSFPEKQECHLARLLVVRRRRVGNVVVTPQFGAKRACSASTLAAGATRSPR